MQSGDAPEPPDEAERLRAELGFVPPRRRGGKRARRQLTALTAKLEAGDLTHEDLEARPSRTLFALGLSAHPETGHWAGDQADEPGAPVIGPPTPPPPPSPPADKGPAEVPDAAAIGPCPPFGPPSASRLPRIPPAPPTPPTRRVRVPPPPPAPKSAPADAVARRLASGARDR